MLGAFSAAQSDRVLIVLDIQLTRKGTDRHSICALKLVRPESRFCEQRKASRSPYYKVEDMEDVRGRLTSIDPNSRATYWRVAWEEWKEHPLTGTGAGTFSYTWLENRPRFGGLKQVHNVFLEQGTETGVVAFLALTGFAVILTGYAARAALRATGERKVLLAGLTGAVVVYLVSSAFEWHWYIPASTIYFFVLAGVTVRLAARAEPTPPDGIRE